MKYEMYMCKNDWHYEMENDYVKLASSIEELDKCKDCAKECGVYKVSVELIESVRDGE